MGELNLFAPVPVEHLETGGLAALQRARSGRSPKPVLWPSGCAVKGNGGYGLLGFFLLLVYHRVTTTQPHRPGFRGQGYTNARLSLARTRAKM